MSKKDNDDNSIRTSKKVASTAGKELGKEKSSPTAKRLAGSALVNRKKTI